MIKIVIDNKDKELTKIIGDWDKACKMYGLDPKQRTFKETIVYIKN